MGISERAGTEEIPRDLLEIFPVSVKIHEVHMRQVEYNMSRTNMLWTFGIEALSQKKTVLKSRTEMLGSM